MRDRFSRPVRSSLSPALNSSSASAIRAVSVPCSRSIRSATARVPLRRSPARESSERSPPTTDEFSSLSGSSPNSESSESSASILRLASPRRSSREAASLAASAPSRSARSMEAVREARVRCAVSWSFLARSRATAASSRSAASRRSSSSPAFRRVSTRAMRRSSSPMRSSASAI